jgi:hypothetical protein
MNFDLSLLPDIAPIRRFAFGFRDNQHRATSHSGCRDRLDHL